MPIGINPSLRSGIPWRGIRIRNYMRRRYPRARSRMKHGCGRLGHFAYSPEKRRIESVTRAIWNATKIRPDLRRVIVMACSLELCGQGEMVVSLDHHPAGLIT